MLAELWNEAGSSNRMRVSVWRPCWLRIVDGVCSPDITDDGRGQKYTFRCCSMLLFGHCGDDLRGLSFLPLKEILTIIFFTFRQSNFIDACDSTNLSLKAFDPVSSRYVTCLDFSAKRAQECIVLRPMTSVLRYSRPLLSRPDHLCASLQASTPIRQSCPSKPRISAASAWDTLFEFSDRLLMSREARRYNNPSSLIA